MEEDKYIVYLHINKINNKVYVGITKFSDPNKRWNRGYRNNGHFSAAILKYGWNNFEHVVLFRNLPKSTACIIERLLIKRYRKSSRCYNLSGGGEGLFNPSQEVRNKISNAITGIKRSEETKKRISEAKKGFTYVRSKESCMKTVATRKARNNYKTPTWLWNRDLSGHNNPMYGRHLSEEAKAKKYKAVIQLDKEGNIVNEYKSVKEASNKVNISSTHIVSALRGRSKSAAGFIWKYKS